MNTSPLPDDDSGVAENSALFADVVARIRADGYCVVANAVPEVLASNLYRQIAGLAPNQFVAAGIGRHDGHQHNQHVRRDVIRWIDGASAAERQWLAWTAQLQRYLNRHLFLGLFSFESHFARFDVGDFYTKHVDAFRGQSNRKLSVVAYLNRDWGADDGGELLIYGSPSMTKGRAEDIVAARVAPVYRTLVIFLSEEFSHEVLPAKRERFSIAGWFRVNNSIANRVDPPS